MNTVIHERDALAAENATLKKRIAELEAAHALLMQLHNARAEKKAALQARNSLNEYIREKSMKRMRADKTDYYLPPELSHWETAEERKDMKAAHDRVLQASYQVGAALRAIKKYGDANK